MKNALGPRVYVFLFVVVFFAGCGTFVRFKAANERTATQISGSLFRPSGSGPFPAVVLLHGCDGVAQPQGSWAIHLKQQGFVALIVDSFTPRGAEVCSTSRDITIQDRMEDAYGALLYLSSLQFVDSTRIGVMGWSHGGAAVIRLLVAEDAYWERIVPGKRYSAGVAFYPGCKMHGSYFKFVPGSLLILAGEDDQWSPADNCKSYVESGAEVHLFPGAHHGFDYVNGPLSPTQVRGAQTSNAIVAYHPAAAAKAEKIAHRFLADRLIRPGLAKH